MNQNENIIIILDQIALIAQLSHHQDEERFSLDTLRQINGSFVNLDNSLNTANITKLFNKIDQKDYHLVLPDKLFNDKIFAVPSIDDEEIKNYLSDEILPEQPYSFETHQIHTSFLLQLKESCRIQISAASHELIDQVSQCLPNSEFSIIELIPFSWLTKIMVEMEPAITIVEIAQKVYLAQHYIGIVDTAEFEADDLTSIVNKVKSIRKSETNLQIAYLLTDKNLENELKTSLKGIVPLQQIATSSREDGISASIQAYLENGLKSIKTEEYATPKYEITAGGMENFENVEEVEEIIIESEVTFPEETDEIIIDEQAIIGPEEIEVELEINSDLSDEASVLDEAIEEILDEELDDGDEITINETVNTTISYTQKDELGNTEYTEEITQTTTEELTIEKPNNLTEDEIGQEIGNIVVPHPTAGRTSNHILSSVGGNSTIITRQKPEDAVAAAAAATAASQIRPSQQILDSLNSAHFEKPIIDATPSENIAPIAVAKATPVAPKAPIITNNAPRPSDIIRNSPIINKAVTMEKPESKIMDQFEEEVISPILDNKVSRIKTENEPAIAAQRAQAKPNKMESESSFGKKILIFLGIFILTVAIGLGLGFGLLNIIDSKTPNTPVANVPAPIEVIDPQIEAAKVAAQKAASEAAQLALSQKEIKREDIKILIVNATNIAGLAGKSKTKLETAGYKNVAAGNAKAKTSYDKEGGNLLLMSEKNDSLLKDIAKESGLSLNYDQSFYAKEDPDKKYDAVIVLIEE